MADPNDRRPGLASPDAELTHLILGLKHSNRTTDEIVDAVLHHVRREEVIACRLEHEERAA